MKQIEIKESKISSIGNFIINKYKSENINIISLNPTRYLTRQINDYILEKLNISRIIIPALKTETTFKINKNKKNNAIVEEKLIIGIGAHVMLVKNLNISNNLCNGAIGIVTEIKTDNNNFVEYISVYFYKTKITKKIERMELEIEIFKGTNIQMMQFPLILSWAITIHKVQGQTLEYILVDIGN
jgi:ATP-dependent exoDNAse (exonuclease V) alpha subunit